MDQRGFLGVSSLPRGGAFLEEHKSHDIQYLDEKYLAEQWKLGDEWRQVKASR